MKNALRWLDKNLEEILMSYALWAIVLIMGLQVIMRYIFRSSLSWSIELSEYIFMWLSFLALSHGVHTNAHIRLDLTETFFPKLRKPLEIVGDIVFIIFVIYMINPGISVVKRLITTNQTSSAMGIPMYFVYVSLLVGFILTLFRFIQKYYKKFFAKGDGR